MFAKFQDYFQNSGGVRVCACVCVCVRVCVCGGRSLENASNGQNPVKPSYQEHFGVKGRSSKRKDTSQNKSCLPLKLRATFFLSLQVF